MIGVLMESVFRTRFLLPHALVVTLHVRFGVFTSWAVSASSKPLLLTSPRLSSRVKLEPSEGATGTATSASFEVLL